MIPAIITACGLFGVAVALFYSKQVSAIPVDQGSETPEESNKIKSIHKAIADGAMAFLMQEYRYLTIFVIAFAAVIGLFVSDPHVPATGIYTAIAFVFGCVISILSGFIGMKIATIGNVRTTTSARSSIEKAFDIALKSGAVMGFALVSLATLGLIAIFYLMRFWLSDLSTHVLMEIIAGFGLGGSSIALFARVGGGIYTKAADVGADLVGKVEQGIPEDDPRNPAVIADNVGDNVGDVAGMGADLFGSCAESACAALVIGATVFAANIDALLYPVLLIAIGIPVSFITILTVKVQSAEDVNPALKKMLVISSILMGVAALFASLFVLPEFITINGEEYTNIGIYLCFIFGLIGGLAIGLLTEYFTSHDYKPVRHVAQSSDTGAATTIISGLALGYHSALGPTLVIAAVIFASFTFGGMYGVAIASLGTLGTLAIALTIDAYGPVADNAGGIAEMTGLGSEVRSRTDHLDAAGNTTAAIGKGFAIGSAILTALALFAAFLTRANSLDPDAQILEKINLLDPLVLAGIFIGAVLPFSFSAMTMQSVSKAAGDMIEEVRKQFREITGLMEGKAEPDYKRCVAISTQAALREMIAPGALILGTPLVIGFLFGIQALAGVLIGALTAGGVLAIASANSGGAWDNAKKYIEAGNLGGKGSENHKAAVVGDTVGDPLKDTSGPSLNVLIKLSAILSLVFVPFFVEYGGIISF